MGLFSKFKKTKGDFGTVWEGINKNGKHSTIEAPSTKSRRYCQENKSGVETFTGEILTKNQKAYRAGYTKSQTDNANMYKCKQRHKNPVVKASIRYDDEY